MEMEDFQEMKTKDGKKSSSLKERAQGRPGLGLSFWHDQPLPDEHLPFGGATRSFPR